MSKYWLLCIILSLCTYQIGAYQQIKLTIEKNQDQQSQVNKSIGMNTLI
jgi:hypothetical protein